VLHDFVHVDVEDEVQPYKINRLKQKKRDKEIQTSFEITSSAYSSPNDVLF